MPSASEIAAVMAEMDSRNQRASSPPVSNIKSMPSMNLTGLRSAMAGVLPGGWSSDHAAETEKFAGWHYIAIHAVYKQVIQAGVEVYERKLVVPSLQKPQAAPPAPVMAGQQPPPMMSNSFTKGINDQQETMLPMPHYDPLMKKLKRPNPAQTLSAFNGERAIQLCLTGRAITWNVRSKLTGKIIERYVIPTCLAQPRPPSRELPRGGWYVLPEGARYANEAGFYMTGSLEAAFGKTIPAEDVQVIKFPHPKFKDDGQSPISASALWTDTSEMVDKSRHNHLKNGPDPSVVIGLDGEVDETSIRRGEAVFNERYAGVDKHGKAMFVTPAKTIQPLTTAPKDMSYEGGFEQLRDAQLAIHGVPLAAVGLSSPTGREGLYAPLLQFIELSVQPVLKLMGDEDSALFTEECGREIEICYTAKKFNDEDLLEKQIQTDISAGVITKGELRKLRGREPFGDERDDEIAGAAAAAPAMPGMPGAMGPDGQPIGPDGMPVPDGSNPEQMAGMMTKPTKQPLGRALNGGKPRLASQIAKAFAKELERYGIVKGGEGSGNHGHCGGEGGAGHPGGSRPADECGNEPSRQQGPAAEPTMPASAEGQPEEKSRFAERNPHSLGISPLDRRSLSQAAFAYVAERVNGREGEIGESPSASEGERSYLLNEIGWDPESLSAHHLDFFAEERSIARQVYRGTREASEARAEQTSNFFGISQDEARSHLDLISLRSAAGSRVNALIMAHIGPYSPNDVNAANSLALQLASQGMNETQISQAINLMWATQGVDWSGYEPGDAPRIAANAVSGRLAEAAAPQAQQQVQPQNGPSAKVPKTREVPEAVDGTQAKQSKIIDDIKRRASKVSFAEELPEPDEDEVMEELQMEADEAFPEYEYSGEIADNAADEMRNSVNDYSDLPRDIKTAIDDFLQTFGDEFTESISTDRSIERFWDDNQSDFEDAIQLEAGDDEEKASELKDRLQEVYDDFILEGRNAAEGYESALDAVRAEWTQDYVNNEFDTRMDEKRKEGGFSGFAPNTWYEDGKEAKLKLVTRSGQEFNLETRRLSSSSTNLDIPGTHEDMLFTDETGTTSITNRGRGAQFEVFRGVSAALLARMENQDIDVLTYTAIEPNRQELYDKLTQTLAQVDGKYVAAVTGGGMRSAEYIVVKREHKERLAEYLSLQQKDANWLVKQYRNGYMKSAGARWIRWYEYSKGGPGSGNFGHCGGDGGEGNPGGSKPADECGTGKKKPAAKKRAAKKPAKQPAAVRANGEKQNAADKAGEVKNPKILSLHPAAPTANKMNISIDVSESDKKDWNHSEASDITQFNKDRGYVRGDSESMSVVEYSKELERNTPKTPLLTRSGTTSTLIPENIERVAVKLADMTEEADAIDPTWAKWYSEIEEVAELLTKEEGQFNFSQKSQEFLKTAEGQKFFVAMLAVSSQEAAPNDNLISTRNLVDFYTENGRMPNKKEASELVKSKSRDIIAGNVVKYSKVMDHFDGDINKAFDFMNSPVRAGRLQEVFKEIGVETTKGQGFTDQYVPHSYLFGPKIGAFHANLGGVENLLTQDRWLTRTIGRLTGTVGFTEEQVQKSFANCISETKTTGKGKDKKQYTVEYEPTDEHLKYMGMKREEVKLALRTLAKGGEVSDEVLAKFSKLAQAHVSSGKESKNPIIERNDFTTKLNTAMKKTKDIINSPGSSASRHANQLAAEAAVEILKQRGRTFTVREIQAAVWMLEKKRWYEAGVGSKKGDANSYKVALEKMRRGEIIENDDEDYSEDYDGDGE